MTLVDAQTGEIMDELSATAARDLTDQIKVAVDATWHLVKRAYQQRAWSVLGYESWDDYCTREFGTSRLRLPREDRQEVVASLRDSGLSVRAIAAATGDSRETVRRALASGDTNGSPAPQPSPEPQPAPWRNTDSSWPAGPASVRDPEPEPAPIPTPPRIQGTDGKSYSSSGHANGAKPRRLPLGDQAERAGWDFRKAVERMERIADDDRFTANKDQVAAHLHGHLTYAIEVCQDLLDRLNQGEQ